MGASPIHELLDQYKGSFELWQFELWQEKCCTNGDYK